MMGTEKLNRRFVGTALVSVLLSLLLALTPVLAVAEPAGEGGASADVAEIAPASTSLVTVPTTITSWNATTTSLSATVTYDGNFAKGETVRFTYNVQGSEKPLLFRLFSFSIKSGNSWDDVIDITKSSYSAYSSTNYFEEKLYSAGTYRVTFQAVEYTDNGDGTKTLGDPVRFQAQFTVSESGDLKSVDTIVNEVVGQCNSECAKQGDTSDYAKALWLNDWVVDNTEYDYSFTYMSAEGVFGRGLGTCEAYHDAYVRLLNKAGIETRRVDSSGDTHVWTGVKLDGKWYNVDTTWNDPGFTDSNVDLKRLYFALPTNIMKLVHTQWDGAYSLGYPNRAAFDAESYEDNYFIRSGEISKFTKPYLEASGTYSVRTHLDARETSFTIPVANSSLLDSYRTVIYNLVAYQLSREDWGSGVGVTVTYANGNMQFQATYLVSIAGATVTVANQTYTGKALTPKPTVTLSGYGTLREGTDYTVAYGSNVNVGTGSVTIIGTGNYTGSRKATFKIEPKPGASTGGGSGSSTAPSGVAMHRLYNPNSGEHFYTASAHERDSLRRAGWKYEGVGWTAPASSRTPVHRLYSGTDHHYTASAAERDMLVRAGWKYEGVGWYSDDAKGVPLYRQFNPNVNPGAPRNNSGSHNYTTSRAEHDHLVRAGWRGEGIGWYGM